MASCKYAKLGRNNLFLCELAKSEKWNTCGNQRYCPKQGRPILTDEANKCPVRERHKDKTNGGQ
jgi:hypothetical protein